jgi:hypothetical protein
MCYEVRRAEACVDKSAHHAGTREEPGTLTQGAPVFLVPLVWESNPKLQGGWCKTQPPALLMFITAVPIVKLFAWGKGGSGGHVLRDTTSRGLCGLVCPSRTS